jgi:putative PIN family toxin of toxin-antitoxin system
MIKAVLDTNVLVSGLLSPYGNPAKVVNHFRDRQFILIYNDEIVAEYRRVLFRGRLGLPPEDVDSLLEEIARRGIPLVATKSDIALPDENDRIFYDLANTCNAYLITGNAKHYPEEPHILTPAQFVELLVGENMI